VKRFTVDAGQLFDTFESTFNTPSPRTLPVALGLNKNPAYAEQAPTVTTFRAPDTLIQWVRQRSAGDFGTAIVLPGADGYAADADNELILAKARSGEFPNAKAWLAYVEAYRQRIAAPIRVEVGME
jgi:hypothetical protein